MKAYRLVLLCLGLLAPLAVAQDRRGDALLNVRENAQAMTQSGPGSMNPSASNNLPFCLPKTCLYYAGDFDSNSSGANALLNSNADFTWGYVYVGVRPTRSALVTGATFNEFLGSGFMGLNPTPFEVREKMSAGQPGSIVCNATGSATTATYGEADFGYTQYSYTIKKLSKPCQLRKGHVYFVNLEPIASANVGYLVDVDSSAPNHRGWKNVLNDSFSNSNISGTPYEPTWGSNGACGGTGCSGFSIALTGKSAQ